MANTADYFRYLVDVKYTGNSNLSPNVFKFCVEHSESQILYFHINGVKLQNHSHGVVLHISRKIIILRFQKYIIKFIRYDMDPLVSN